MSARNPSWLFQVLWLWRMLWWLLFWTALVGLGAGCTVMVFLWQTMPSLDQIKHYQPAQSTKVFAKDRRLIGEFYVERRTVVPFDKIPKHVIKAFLAAEDADFFTHKGIDYWGLLRAMLKNLRPHAHLQGASTITQQLVKTLVLGSERSIWRKLRELFLSHALEQTVSKEHVLYLYLNQIYFGQGVFGIEEAAQLYFGKSTQRLNVGEAAYLAAIPKNPKMYNLRAYPQRAKQRQIYVLQQMAHHGFIEEATAEQLIKRPIPAVPKPPPSLEGGAYYLEYIRRQLGSRYGESALLRNGLRVQTSLDPRAQQAATTAMRQSLEDVARRRGLPSIRRRLPTDQLAQNLGTLRQTMPAGGQQRFWVWDLCHLPVEAAAHARVRWLPATAYARSCGVISQRSNHGDAWVDLGGFQAELSVQRCKWLRRSQPQASPEHATSLPSILQVGDVVDVVMVPQANGFGVELLPQVPMEGALVAIEPHSREVVAMVGGYEDGVGMGFNRAIQAKRQSGSAFKPMVYAAALGENIVTPASICPDSPVVVVDPWTGSLWKPTNFEDNQFSGNITYRTALMRSKNTCSVRLVQKLGYEKVQQMAAAMGIASKLPNNLTIALGTGETTVLELTNAYATIAAQGQYAPPVFILSVSDANGMLLESASQQTTTALTPQVAYILTNMMQSVIEHGTGLKALMLERPLAGKTGTSQESRDAWFAGFSPELVAAVWIGYDNNASLGYETGASASLPAWIRFMGQTLAGLPPTDFVMPEHIVRRPIDQRTGMLSNDPNATMEVFIEGTEPKEYEQTLPTIYLEDQ